MGDNAVSRCFADGGSPSSAATMPSRSAASSRSTDRPSVESIAASTAPTGERTICVLPAFQAIFRSNAARRTSRSVAGSHAVTERTQTCQVSGSTAQGSRLPSTVTCSLAMSTASDQSDAYGA